MYTTNINQLLINISWHIWTDRYILIMYIMSASMIRSWIRITNCICWAISWLMAQFIVIYKTKIWFEQQYSGTKKYVLNNYIITCVVNFDVPRILRWVTWINNKKKKYFRLVKRTILYLYSRFYPYPKLNGSAQPCLTHILEYLYNITIQYKLCVNDVSAYYDENWVWDLNRQAKLYI